VVAGGIFPKDEVEQQLMYFKNKVFTITDTMYWYCTKEDDGLTEGAYCSCTAGYEMYACFFLFSISCLCSANSGPLDNNKRDCNQSWLKCS
jgi:hypothetical protein